MVTDMTSLIIGAFLFTPINGSLAHYFI